jgi:hypothetical protein
VLRKKMRRDWTGILLDSQNVLNAIVQRNKGEERILRFPMRGKKIK